MFEPITLSHKNVGFKDDFKTVDKMSRLINSLGVEIISKKINRSGFLDEIATTKKIMLELENLITERFGFNARILVNENTSAGVMNIITKHDDTLYPANARVWGYIKQFLNANCKDNPKCIVNTKKDIRSEDDIVKVLVQQDKNVKAIEKELGSGLLIDFENRKIKNLPEHYVVVFSIDFVSILKELSLTDREMTAVILHEVGHVMTKFYNMNRTYRHVTGLLNRFLENVNTSNNSIDYMKVFAKSELQMEVNDKPETFLIDFAANMMIKSNSDDVVSATDAEHQADVFATGFGLSFELSSAVVKLNKYYRQNEFAIVLYSALYVASIVSIIAIIISGAAAAGLAFTASFIYVLMVTVLGKQIESIVNKKSSEKTYDELPRRIKRIRNELIKNMEKMDSLTRSRNLEELLLIEDMIVTSTKGQKFVSKLFDNLPWTKGKTNHRALLEILEDLQANDIAVARAMLLNELKNNKR